MRSAGPDHFAPRHELTELLGEASREQMDDVDNALRAVLEL